MLRFLDAMEALNPQIVPELAWQMGRPVRYGGELRSLAERVRALVDLAEHALAPHVAGSGRYVARLPAGLVSQSLRLKPVRELFERTSAV